MTARLAFRAVSLLRRLSTIKARIPIRPTIIRTEKAVYLLVVADATPKPSREIAVVARAAIPYALIAAHDNRRFL